MYDPKPLKPAPAKRPAGAARPAASARARSGAAQRAGRGLRRQRDKNAPPPIGGGKNMAQLKARMDDAGQARARRRARARPRRATRPTAAAPRAPRAGRGDWKTAMQGADGAARPARARRGRRAKKQGQAASRSRARPAARARSPAARPTAARAGSPPRATGARARALRRAPSHLIDPEQLGAGVDGALRRCGALLADLLRTRQAKEWFSLPVDPEKQGIPFYPVIITQPMDLSTVKHKLAAGTYASPDAFAYDVRLVFANAMCFNVRRDAAVHMAAPSCAAGSAGYRDKCSARRARRRARRRRAPRGRGRRQAPGAARERQGRAGAARAGASRGGGAPRSRARARGPPLPAYADAGAADGSAVPQSTFESMQRQMEAMAETIQKRQQSQMQIEREMDVDEAAARAGGPASPPRRWARSSPTTARSD